MSKPYPALIVWSEDDNAFLATCPQLEGCIAHGETHQEALENLEDTIDAWLESAKEEGWTVPRPLTTHGIAKKAGENQKRKQQEIEKLLKNALDQITLQVASEIAKKMSKDVAKVALQDRKQPAFDRQSLLSEAFMEAGSHETVLHGR